VNKRTYTILELLIVLLILGVIVALSIEQYNGSKELAKTYTFVTNVNEIVEALSTYKSNKVLLNDLSNLFPTSLNDLQFKALFTKEPINPYTGKSMLSSTSTDSGLLYQSTGPTYKLCVVQRDIEDVNNNGVVDEVLPLTTKSVCIGDMRSNIQLTFIRPSVAYTNNGTFDGNLDVQGGIIQ